jgi:hypothetical protein
MMISSSGALSPGDPVRIFSSSLCGEYRKSQPTYLPAVLNVSSSLSEKHSSKLSISVSM